MKLLGSSEYFSNKNNQINENKWKYGKKSYNKKICLIPIIIISRSIKKM